MKLDKTVIEQNCIVDVSIIRGLYIKASTTLLSALSASLLSLPWVHPPMLRPAALASKTTTLFSSADKGTFLDHTDMFPRSWPSKTAE